MPNHRATQRKPSALLVEHQLEGQWRPAPASPLPTIQALAASEHSASPFGHSFGELALFPEASTADSAWGGAAPPAPIAVQRLIYKDEKARDEKAPYADITRVPWYEGKKSPEDKALILRAAKTGDAHWTTDEVDAFLKKRESFADYVAYQERLSGHEDLVTHGKVAPTDRLLTPEEFSALPKQGSINPYRLRTAQGGIELRFRDESKGKVKDLAEMLAKDPTYSRTNKIRNCSGQGRLVGEGWLAA
jgi:hypothetical protein